MSEKNKLPKPKIYCEMLLEEKHKSTEMKYEDVRGNCWQVTCPLCGKTIFIFLPKEFE